MAKHPDEPRPPAFTPRPAAEVPPAPPQPGSTPQPPPAAHPPPQPGPGEPDEPTKKALAKVTAAASREGYEAPKAEGKGTYLVSFGYGWPPQAVEADGPAEAARAAADLLGILRWERQPDLIKVE